MCTEADPQELSRRLAETKCPWNLLKFGNARTMKNETPHKKRRILDQVTGNN